MHSWFTVLFLFYLIHMQLVTNRSICSWFTPFYPQSLSSSQDQHYKKAKLYGNVAMGLSMAAVAWGFIGIIIAIGVTSQVFPGFQFPCICISSKYGCCVWMWRVHDFCHIYHFWMCLIHKFHPYGFSWPHVHTTILIWASKGSHTKDNLRCMVGYR